MNSHAWIKAFLTLIATVVATLVLVTTAYAGDQHHDKGHQCPAYGDLDANDDNAVSAEEFYTFRSERMAARVAEGRKMKNADKAPSFEDLDLDGDGNLSAEEFAAHHDSCPMKSHGGRGKHREQ